MHFLDGHVMVLDVQHRLMKLGKSRFVDQSGPYEGIRMKFDMMDWYDAREFKRLTRKTPWMVTPGLVHLYKLDTSEWLDDPLGALDTIFDWLIRGYWYLLWSVVCGRPFYCVAETMLVWSDDVAMNKKIKYVLDNFDFEKVRTAMEAVGWTWLNKPESPTVEEMREKATRLFYDLYEDKNAFAHCGGGFEAFRCEGDDYGLRFVLQSAFSEDGKVSNEEKPTGG